MYNNDIPTRAELPSAAQLLRSTIIAILAAAVLLVTVVLPAEYAIDPTGIGRVLRLTEMGEIKQQLAAEAEADRARDQAPAAKPDDRRSGLWRVFAAPFLPTPAMAQTPSVPPRSDETTITLRPAEGVEWKMTMAKGARVEFTWTVQGGVANYDMHGTPAAGGKESSYKSARGVAGDSGVLTAGFDGTHGWFWRNRGRETVTITLRTSGAYTGLRRMN